MRAQGATHTKHTYTSIFPLPNLYKKQARLLYNSFQQLCFFILKNFQSILFFLTREPLLTTRMHFNPSFLIFSAFSVTTVTAEFLKTCSSPTLENGIAYQGVLTSICENGNYHGIVTSLDPNTCINTKDAKLYVRSSLSLWLLDVLTKPLVRRVS